MSKRTHMLVRTAALSALLGVAVVSEGSAHAPSVGVLRGCNSVYCEAGTVCPGECSWRVGALCQQDVRIRLRDAQKISESVTLDSPSGATCSNSNLSKCTWGGDPAQVLRGRPYESISG